MINRIKSITVLNLTIFCLLFSVSAFSGEQIENIETGKCLDVPNLSKKDGTKIQQYTCRDNDRYVAAQLWNFIKVTPYYQIQNVASGKCLDVPNVSKENGVVIQQYTCRGDDKYQKAQLWKLVNVDDYYQIKNIGSGKCLDFASTSLDNGVKLKQYTCDPYIDAQLWDMVTPVNNNSNRNQ